MTGTRDAERQVSLELAEGVASVPAAEWNALVGDESPFLEWEWLASLEQSGCVAPDKGWQAMPLLVRDAERRLLAACPLYVKQHSEGEFVFDWGWADAAARAGIDYYPKLLVGVPFTPVTGARLLTAPGADRPAAWRCGPRAARAVRAERAVGRARELLPAGRGRRAGARRLPVRVGFQYQWRNEGFRSFEEYLGGSAASAATRCGASGAAWRAGRDDGSAAR